MRSVVMGLVLACVVGGGGVACSSETVPIPPRKPGVLGAGTAEIAVGGHAPMTTDEVVCQPAGALTFVRTGDDQSGATVVIANDDPLRVRSVELRNLGGFTGSYQEGLDGRASITMTDRQYAVSGTAMGVVGLAPSFRTSGSFTINVAC